jgi:hypothetical protein
MPLPRWRYKQDAYPNVVLEILSIVHLDPQKHFGADLALRQIPYDAQPRQQLGAMGGNSAISPQLACYLSALVHRYHSAYI